MFGIDSILSEPLKFIAAVTALIVSIGFHEFSHVFVAYSLGDMTGKNAGRLTLNPFRHLDLVGTMLILIGAFIGWGKPAPFNPQNLRYRRYGSAIVALGGPLSNLLLLTVFSIMLHLFYPSLGPENLLVIFLGGMVLINASLLLFNLIPLPPLDGSWVLLSVLPRSADPLRQFLSQYGWFILIGVLLFDFMLGIPIISPYLYNGILFLLNSFGVLQFLGGV